MTSIRPYTVQKLGTDKYLVIGNDNTRFDELLPDVSEELKKKNFKGSIVFDLLLSNGNNSSRFFEIKFNGSKAELNTLKKLKEPEPRILGKVKKYLSKNIEILYNGVLSSSEIKRITSSLQL